MDIVADVLQQAEVTKLKVATAKLIGKDSKIAAEGRLIDFQELSAVPDLKHVQTATRHEFKKDQSRVPGHKLEDVVPSQVSRDDQKKEAMRGLETILATKMVEAMMPKDQSELYGDGTAGEIWRGFHIETMGKALASQQVLSTSRSNGANANDDAGRNGRTKLIVPFAG